MSLSSHRYAKALLDLSEERAQSPAVAQDMAFVREALGSSRELQVFLSSPVVKPFQKKNVLSQVFASLSELSQKFIVLVVDHGRESVLSHIAQNYMDAYRRRLGTVAAKVTSAVALTEAQRALIEGAILASGAKAVELTEEVNPDLIGGLVVRVGDKQIDTSIAQSLRSLDRSFQKNLYIADF
jgi:F-type H+-transporting ATPase subunit delta